MKPFVVLYATREGQTRRIAHHIEARVNDHGHPARIRRIHDIREPFDLDRYEGAILAASVHLGKHEPEVVEFVKRHRDKLEKLPTALLSVSLSEAGAEDPTRTEDEREEAAADVRGAIDGFLRETGWRPKHIKAVAGALVYSKYNFITRFVMKQIAKKRAIATDTAHDYEFTDWKAVDHFADEILGEVIAHAVTRGHPAPA